MKRLASVLAALFALAPIQGFAQSDSAAPEHQGLIKRKLHEFLNDDGKEGTRGLHLGPFEPRIEILSTDAGPGPMLHFWTPHMFGSRLDFHVSGSYSIYGYQYYDAQFGLVPHEDKKLPKAERGTGTLFPLADLEKTAALDGFQIYVSARRRDYPREDFYGLGAGSLKANHTDYRLQDDFYEAVIRTRMSRLSLMGRAGLLRPEILAGKDDLFPDIQVSNTERTAPGLTHAPDFMTLSASAWLEFRDQPLNPHSGASFGVSLARFDDRRSNAFQFNRVVVDAREYLPLGSHRHVIALRQVAYLDTPDANSKVPFYLQPNFGGSSFLRGYGASRFRDDKLLALAAEYRFGLHKNVQLALIYEAGKVFPTISDLSLSGLQHSYGAGFRLKTLKRVKFRVDVLHSPERTRVDVKLGQSF